MSRINIESIDVKDLNSIRYEYALLYYPGDVVLNKQEMISDINYDEIQEAYFFDKTGQVHLFDDGLEKKAVRFNHFEGDYVEKGYVLSNKHKEIGNTIIVREYMESDEDGQNYVAYTALKEIV